MQSTIRLANREDAAAIQSIYAPIVTETAISFELEPPSVEEMRRRIETTLQTYPWLVCDEREVIGYAYGGLFRSRAAYQWTVEVSVYVHADHRGKAVARALYASLFDWLKVQGYATAVAGVVLPSPASMALHKSLGFQQVGVFHRVGNKFGAWHDVVWWELPLQELPDPAPAPRALPEVVKSGEWPAPVTGAYSRK